ncbi:MAG: hypothetical protein EBW14_05215 [Oxalobacteraceae bacterium]|nr:hypothetical protein [Oxalobacteraceae bacterium]
MKHSVVISALWLAVVSVLTSTLCLASEIDSTVTDKENQADNTLGRITLEEVLRIAAETHPTVAQRLSEQGASDYSAAGARWQRWPGVSMSSSRSPLGSTLTEVQVEQPIWTGGRITANINAAEARAEAARHSVFEARKIIIERAINAYAEAMRLQARITIADAAIEDFEQLTAMIDRRVPSLSLRYQRIFGGGTLYATDQVFLGVTFQPGSGLSSLSAISEAEARRTGTTYAREATRLDLMNRVKNLWQQADSSRREQIVLGDLVASTQEVYASCLRQFPVGRRTWLEVLLARRDATQAQYAHSDTRWTGFAAELKLQLITGQLAARNYRINAEASQ